MVSGMFFKRPSSIAAPGYRRMIAPLVAHNPVTEAGRRRREERKANSRTFGAGS